MKEASKEIARKVPAAMATKAVANLRWLWPLCRSLAYATDRGSTTIASLAMRPKAFIKNAMCVFILSGPLAKS